jgi:NAD-dependent SIR2 family protein deacetylase
MSFVPTMFLFSDVKNFDHSHLRPTETVVRHLPVVGAMPTLSSYPCLLSPSFPIVPSAELVCGEEHDKEHDKENDTKRLNADRVFAHGLLGAHEWVKPRMVVQCSDEARPGYNTCSAAEYVDEFDVFDKKVQIVADLIRKSSHRVIYSGAGISTASGIADYASVAKGSIGMKLQQEKWLPSQSLGRIPMHPLDAQPTLSHKVLTAMHNQGYLDYWVQQNHDGLPQKAGFPQCALNEIHGAWYDPSNPVVPMNGNLRNDLFNDLLQWERKVDFCLVLGTSLCGMNSDRIVASAANTFIKNNGKSAGGAVIVGLQSTKLDHLASVRIFATIDDTMRLLAQKLQIHGRFEADAQDNNLKEIVPKNAEDANNIFNLPYDSRSGKKNSSDQLHPFDFREKAFVKINGGPHDGAAGFVSNIRSDGHYKMTFFVSPFKGHNVDTVESEIARTLRPYNCIMGRWWIEGAKSRSIQEMPVTCLDPSVKADAQIIENTKERMKPWGLL